MDSDLIGVVQIVFREVCELKKRGTWLAFMDGSTAYDTVVGRAIGEVIWVWSR